MEFPSIQPGGSLLIAWQVRNKNVLVVGGGNVAAGRIFNLLNADAIVTVVAPLERLVPEVRHRIEHGHVKYYQDREFVDSDLDDKDMVLSAIDSPSVSTEIWQLCKQRRIPVNVADVPTECDFYFGSQHRDGPLQIVVSTSGNAPRLTSLIRKRIADCLEPGTGKAITNVGQLRRKLRKSADGPDQSQRRMEWMSRVCDTWSLGELVQLNEERMDKLVSAFHQSRIPTYKELTGRPFKRPIYEFDGSLGFMT